MSPYREVDHTADWALHVWAPTRQALFVEAARGTFALAGAHLSEPAGAPVTRVIELHADDHEILLVAWLQELLYQTEAEGSVWTDFRIQALTPTLLRAEAAGFSNGRVDKPIKAVTFHNLSIDPTSDGFEVTIVYDV